MFTLLVACQEPAPPPDLFDASRIHEIALVLDPGDWDALRHETRSLWDTFSGDCMASPFESPFEWRAGEATIDGVDLGRIGVRKKAFFGSLDEVRPSLKLDLDRFVSETEFDGVGKFTLNNSRVDPTRLRTCLAYEAFAAVGVPAPHCSLAHVTVNGEDLGVYASVEPVDERFLATRGWSADGGLFEGTWSDLRDGWTATFDPKTDASDVASLGRVVDAVATGDLDVISGVVDLGAFFDFWATEVLVGQWDGYAGNTNNYFVYDDPESGKVRFMPWGPDAAFDQEAPFDPAWVSANAALAQAVLLAPGGEDAFRSHLQALLDERWDGEAMAERVVQWAELVRPWEAEGFDEAVIVLEDLVRGKEDLLRAGLAAPSEGPLGALRDPPCFVERGSLSTTFLSSWDTLGRDPWATGASTAELVWDGVRMETTPGGTIAGRMGDEAAVAAYTGMADGGFLVSYAHFPLDRVATGALPFDLVDVVGVLLFSDGTSVPTRAAYLMQGAVAVEGTTESGAPVSGSMQGTLYDFGW